MRVSEDVTEMLLATKRRLDAAPYVGGPDHATRNPLERDVHIVASILEKPRASSVTVGFADLAQDPALRRPSIGVIALSRAMLLRGLGR